MTARHTLRLIRRGLYVAAGFLVILLGVLLSPLPGPGGLPVIVIGLIIVLRNSYWAKRQFVKLQRLHPKFVFPIRRLMRRDPEILPVLWQQWLRVERFALRPRFRFSVNARRHVMGRKPYPPRR